MSVIRRALVGAVSLSCALAMGITVPRAVHAEGAVHCGPVNIPKPKPPRPLAASATSRTASNAGAAGTAAADPGSILQNIGQLDCQASFIENSPGPTTPDPRGAGTCPPPSSSGEDSDRDDSSSRRGDDGSSSRRGDEEDDDDDGGNGLPAVQCTAVIEGPGTPTGTVVNGTIHCRYEYYVPIVSRQGTPPTTLANDGALAIFWSDSKRITLVRHATAVDSIVGGVEVTTVTGIVTNGRFSGGTAVLTEYDHGQQGANVTVAFA